jgi:haloacetate dehalogenase
MALDYPNQIAALAVLDILPTAEHFQRTDMSFAMGYWHWFFLAQPYDLPERLISADPDAFYLRRGRSMFDPTALAEYRRCFSDPDTIHGIDMQLDIADREAGRRIACPVQALWGMQGPIARWYDIGAIWRDWASEVEGQGIDCGHYLAEEAPEATLAALQSFLRKAYGP